MDVIEELKDVEKQNTIKSIKNLKKMRGIKSFIVTFFGGIILFGTPAVILIILNPQNIIDLSGSRQDSEFVASITSLKPQITRWSLWITAVWGIYVVLQNVIYYMPKIILWILTATFGCSETTRMAVEYIPELKNWIVWGIWQILATASFRIFFIQLGLVKEWQMIYNCLWSAMIFAEIFLVQRVFVQILAFNFHKYFII